MKTIALSSLLVFLLLFTHSIKSQDLHLISDVQLFLEPTTDHIMDTSLLMDPMAMEAEIDSFDDTEEFKLSVSVLLLDTVEISKVHVKLGRTQAGSDLFDSYFEFDDNSPSGGRSYSRDGKHIVLGIGDFINLRNIYSELYIENINGVTTQFVLNHINQ